MAQTTKKAIAASLKRLLGQKPLTKITVTDIAKDCNISRHTFYYHFRDVYDLMEWTCRAEGECLLEGKRDYANWRQGMAEIFRYFRDNQVMIQNTLRSGGRDYLMPCLYQRTYDVLLAVVEEKSEGKAISQRHKEFIANFYKHAFAGIVLDWVESGMHRDPADIISDLDILIRGTFVDAIDKFSGNIGSL